MNAGNLYDFHFAKEPRPLCVDLKAEIATKILVLIENIPQKGAALLNKSEGSASTLSFYNNFFLVLMCCSQICNFFCLNSVFSIIWIVVISCLYAFTVYISE